MLFWLGRGLLTDDQDLAIQTGEIINNENLTNPELAVDDNLATDEFLELDTFLEVDRSLNDSSSSMDVINLSASFEKAEFSWPMSEALERITKKPFALYVSPQDSPVQPERFSGYHTGADFETYAHEQDSAVSVYAICSGPVAFKRMAGGYGGVLIQLCRFKEQPVTVIYGHLNLSSIKFSLGEIINQGQEIGILGQAGSVDTDGERKHLHLGIHLGEKINLAGYTSSQEDLDQWLDFLSFLD